jgi:hypothetical protein
MGIDSLPPKKIYTAGLREELLEEFRVNFKKEQLKVV